MNPHIIQPKKSLGQNFLVDKNIAKKIVASLDCKENENILEIGPGTGSLTEFLVELPVNIIAVEIDKRAVGILRNKYSDKKNFQLINSNILEINISEIFSNSTSNISKIFKVIGNIPYNISSEIFFMLFEHNDIVGKSILMVQKEVAMRLTAKTRTKDYGILTVAANLAGTAKILFDVSPSCFFPKPKVTSSIVMFDFSNRKIDVKKFKPLMKFVRAAFNQRRKTLRNSLQNYISENINLKPEDILKSAEHNKIDYFPKRAEELTAEDFIKFYDFLQQIKQGQTFVCPL